MIDFCKVLYCSLKLYLRVGIEVLHFFYQTKLEMSYT